MFFNPALRQLLMGISTSRYFPERGTAGLQRVCVRGDRRVPRPPPRIMQRVSCWTGMGIGVGNGKGSGIDRAVFIFVFLVLSFES